MPLTAYRETTIRVQCHIGGRPLATDVDSLSRRSQAHEGRCRSACAPYRRLNWQTAGRPPRAPSSRGYQEFRNDTDKGWGRNSAAPAPLRRADAAGHGRRPRRHPKREKTGLVAAYQRVWPADSAADADLGNSGIVYRAICRDMLGMADAQVELKVWSVTVHAIRTYLDLRRLYLQKLEATRTPWDRLCTAASTAMDTGLSALAPRVSAIARPLHRKTAAAPISILLSEVR
ncbi:hypothetical protein B0H15DRAFT_957055 [Mycena belliarum]|uniref:Uncharacterized protein n=1 Tax=Mycena belliarum TaxID=1033014 RepID=A0AAD6TQR8_9AGAR|nr:hypothetical protein B0H15DRAFT_957055 [Mycena belliae]